MPSEQGVLVMIDRPRTLRYGGLAFDRFERATGRNLLEGTRALENMNFGEAVSFVWAGLVDEDIALTRDELLRHVNMTNIAGYVKKAGEALRQAFPRTEGAVNAAPLDRESDLPQA